MMVNGIAAERHIPKERKEIYTISCPFSYVFSKEEILHIRLVRGAGGHGHDEPRCKSLL